MNLNVPVLALSLVGVLMALAGLFVQGDGFLTLFGVAIILFAFVLQEMSKRRS